MPTSNKLMPQGRGLAPTLLRRAATIELDWSVRRKAQFSATDSTGRTVDVALAPDSVVRGGDVLVVDDGSLIRVTAKPQPVLVITHCAEHGSALDLLRAAYELGGRHVPVELKPDHLKIEPDRALADLLRSMHLIVRDASEPFDPDPAAGADAAHAHSHSHSHSHDHDHDHGGDRAHRH